MEGRSGGIWEYHDIHIWTAGMPVSGTSLSPFLLLSVSLGSPRSLFLPRVLEIAFA